MAIVGEFEGEVEADVEVEVEVAAKVGVEFEVEAETAAAFRFFAAVRRLRIPCRMERALEIAFISCGVRSEVTSFANLAAISG